MNMTGDPNQRNKPPMFGFECTYPSLVTDFPRFSEGSASMSSPMTAGPRIEDPAPCLFARNSSPFAITNSSIGSVPFTTGYLFPSTSSINIPTSNSCAFPFLQASGSTEACRSFPESSGVAQNANPFLGNHVNWSSSLKSNFTFPVSSSIATTSTNTFTVRSLSGSFGCKRKTESPPLGPLKQHITEERMAEHMSRLHISSQTPTSSSESQPVRERRLYMCEEMQRLQTESIIPAQILEKVHRPCTALVPWRPPIVPPIAKENNNNEEEPDNNLMERSDNMDMDS